MVAAGLVLTGGCIQGYKPDVPVVLSCSTSGAVGAGDGGQRGNGSGKRIAVSGRLMEVRRG
jgi:hypothetical protein